MCGIFGYIHQNGIPNISAINVDKILNHRGPDDSGWLLLNGDDVTLGKSKIANCNATLLLLHKRLSILDLTDTASQPMSCEQQRYFIIFNGEIYNYLELRKELENLGVSFKSRSDSEVLLKSFIKWGKACLDKLVGMFSFAILDRVSKKLFIARDPFGIKPFYYFFDNHRFIFASEIKSIRGFINSKHLNPQRLFFYLRSGMTDYGEETFFEEIKQLPAGHFLEIDILTLKIIDLASYWKIKNEINYDISFNEAADTLRDLFLKNVSMHLRSDVPVAATLSGGIDSSAIVMGIRHLYPSREIHTFSYIADSDHLSEEKWIDQVNQSAGAISHKVFANPESLISDLEHLISIQDEPFGSTSIYAQYRVFQTAGASGMKVLLDGQGADEMLGGYTFYVAARFASLIKQYKFSEALQLLRHTQGNNILLRSLIYLLPTNLQILLRKFSFNHDFSWLNHAWFADQGVNFNAYKLDYRKNVLQEELCYTFTHSSLPMLLRYEDRNSMAYSIESRVPFLTPEIVNFIFSLPENFLINHHGLSKAVFRQAMSGIVPQTILDRRDKIGFATPEKQWLTALKPWIENLLFSDYARQLSIFDSKKIRLHWEKLLQGKTKFDFRYWRWINLIKWCESHGIQI